MLERCENCGTIVDELEIWCDDDNLTHCSNCE